MIKQDFDRLFPEADPSIRKAFCKLIDVFGNRFKVLFVDLDHCDGMIVHDKIGLNSKIKCAEFCLYVLAHEIAHGILHHGNLLGDDNQQAEADADRLAFELCALVGIDVKSHKNALNHFNG